MTTWRHEESYNGTVEYSDTITDIMLSAPRQAVLLAGGAAFRSTDGMSTTLTTPCVTGRGYRNRKGYLVVDRGHLGRVFAHRLAWEETFGSIPDGMQVCHHCDNPPCVNPEHLFLGTNADNVADRVAKGRTLKGSAHPNTRLTEEAVADIKARLSRGEGIRPVARLYGIGFGTVSDIDRGVSWKHVSPARSAFDDALDILAGMSSVPGVDIRTVDRARAVLSALHAAGVPVPDVAPNPRGGVSFDWPASSWYFEVEP